MTDLFPRIIGATLGAAAGWLIGTRLARRLPAVAGWWDEIAPWVDEPDPTSCDRAAVTNWIGSHEVPS
jgi:hypothetical protein